MSVNNNLNDICLSIPYMDSHEIMGPNETIDLNRTLNFIHGWLPPLIFTIDIKIICGPIIKIVEQLSKKLGLK